MSITTSATVEGLDSVLKALDELSQEITKGKTARIWTNAMRYAMQPVKDTTKLLIDAKTDGTGQLQDAVYIRVHKPTARDKQSKSYMGELYMARVSISSKRAESEQATVTYKTKKGKEITKTYTKFRGSNRPIALAVEAGTPRKLAESELGSAKMAPRPFLRPALEQNAQRVQERLRDALWRELTYGKYAQDAGLDFTGKI